jgi:hypothetical protein
MTQWQVRMEWKRTRRSRIDDHPGVRERFYTPRTGFLRVNVSEKENLGSLGLGITPPYPQRQSTTAGWPQSASWRSYFKTTAIPRDSVAAASGVFGFWTPLSRPCLESGVRSFSGGKRGLEEVTVWDAESVCSPWGLQDTHEAVCIRNGEVVRGVLRLHWPVAPRSDRI